MKLQSGQTIPPPPFTPLKSPQTEISLAVAQITNDVAAMITAVSQARAKKADVVVFPERAVAEAALERLQQVWSNLASFQTFTATANVLGSAIWDDLRGLDERRAEVEGLPHPDTGALEVYSPFSANLVVRAAVGQQLITATRRVGPANLYHPRRTSNFNPQMDAWYRLGATIVCPKQD